MPRWWLITLTALVVVPWIIVATLFLRAATPTDEFRASVPATQEPGEVSAARASGVWGQLEITPIVIAPPIEYVPVETGPPAQRIWQFPNATPQTLETFLVSAGVEHGDVARLLGAAQASPAIRGVVVHPDPEVVRRLTPDARARIYIHLLKETGGDVQIDLFRFYGASTEAWLGSGLSPATLRLVEPLTFRRGNFLFFGDLDLVRPQIPDIAELQRLTKRLFRQSTALVKLRVDKNSDINAISDYWGRGGRRTDVRPLLESLANADPRSDHSIDISHLLPPLAREHLYRYPRVTVADFDKPLLPNCFWTALNFFNAEPDDRYLDVNFAMKHLKEDYYVIQDGFQLGDVVAFSDGEGNLFHLAVYLADNLVFGKNGSTYLAPWSILPMERLKGHYIEEADEWHVTVHRRRDL